MLYVSNNNILHIVIIINYMVRNSFVKNLEIFEGS